MEAPRHLRGTLFTRHNIFLNGMSRISDVVDNDGIKEQGTEGPIRSTTLDGESNQQYLLRNFVAGFIDRIKHSPKEGPKYFQWLYPNERKAAVGAEVNVLTHQETQGCPW